MNKLEVLIIMFNNKNNLLGKIKPVFNLFIL